MARKNDPTTPETPQDTAGLDAFFAAAAEAPPMPDAAFLAKLEHDALTALAEGPAPAPAPGPLRQLLAALGGWPGAAGLAAACAAGVWIVASADLSLTGASGTLGSLGIDPASGFEASLLEG